MMIKKKKKMKMKKKMKKTVSLGLEMEMSRSQLGTRRGPGGVQQIVTNEPRPYLAVPRRTN